MLLTVQLDRNGISSVDLVLRTKCLEVKDTILVLQLGQLIQTLIPFPGFSSRECELIWGTFELAFRLDCLCQLMYVGPIKVD